MTTAKNDFGIGEEELMLKSSARRLIEGAWPTTRLHREVAKQATPERKPECVWDEALWKQMVELGWTAMAVPERAGGAGLGVVGIACMLEELGRAALPSPLPSTLAATYVLAACATEGADAALAKIAAGTRATFASYNQQGSWALADTDVTANGSKLTGTSFYVQDAMKAELFVVKAKTPDGVSFFVIEKGAEGVKIVPEAIMDLTRDQAHVVFEGATAQAVGSGASILAKAEPALLCLVSADLVGAAEWQLATTVDYAKTRIQFDRPIGSFQAVKHPLVDLMTMIDGARALLFRAARSIDTEDPEAEVIARMAKARASDAAAFGSGRSVQLHGGIGFTWEHAAHIYFKRQKHSEMLLGDAPYQRARLADLVIGPIGAQ